MITLNLFDNETDNSNNTQRDGIMATRFYIILLVSTFAIIALHSSLALHTQLITIQSPSQSTFEQLYKDYSNNLVCRCTQVTVARDRFLNVKPIYHQVDTH